MLVYFVKAAQKIANQPGMVLYGTPPRWHQFNPAVHTDQDQIHYHAKKATEIKAAKELAAEHAGADQKPDDHVAALYAKAKAIQDKASASAAVTGWKQALMAGKAPTVSQAKAYHTLAQSQPDKAAKLLEGVLDVIGADKYKELLWEMGTKLVVASKAKPKAEAKPEAQPKPQAEAQPDKPVASVQQAIGQAYAVGTGKNIPKDGMGLVQCHFATHEVAKAIDDKKIALPPGTPVKVFEYDEDQQQAFNAAFAKTPKPEGLTSEAAKNLLVDLADKSVNGHSLLKIGDQYVDPHLKSGGASQAEINKVGAFFEKVYAEAAKDQAAPQADAAETKPGNAESTKDAALQVAIDHLEEDKGQADIPPAEQKEDAALVAKLKEAVTAPADQQAPPKPKVVVTKTKAAKEPQAPKPAQAQDTKRVTTSKSVLAAKLDAMKLPITNTNAKAVNGKIAKLEAMVQAGDVAGLKAEKFGSNNYQKKLAKFAAEASAALEKASQAKVDATQAEDDSVWLTKLFGPQATQGTAPDTTVTLNGQTLKKTPYGWDGPNNNKYIQGSPESMVADLLATGTCDTLVASASAKEQAVDLAIQHGVDPLKALNKIAADKDGLSNPYDGDTKTINGVTYQLEGGRWHRVSPKDDDGVTQAMKDAVVRSLFDTQTPVDVLQHEWYKSLANGHQPTQYEAGAYELADVNEQNELLAKAVSQYMDKMSHDDAVKLNKTAKDAGAPHVFAYVADQLLAKHNETLKDYAQANAKPAMAPAKAKTVTLYGDDFTHQNGAWYDDKGEGISEFSPVFLGLEVLSGQGPDPAWLKHFPETTVSFVAHELHKEGVDPVQVMNALFPKGQANLVSGDDYGEGAVYTLGLVDMVLKNGKWEVKKDDAPALAANQPGPQADPVTAGHVDDPDFPGWYAAMLAGKTPTKPQMQAFAQALKDNTKAALWVQQHLENTLGKDAYDLQIKPHFPDLYSKAEKADVLQDWVSSLVHGKAPTIKQALFYDSLSQDEQESLAYQAIQDWDVDPDDDDAVDHALDRLMHLQSLGLDGISPKGGGGAAAQAGTTATPAPKTPLNSVTWNHQVYTKAADGSWKNAAGASVSSSKVAHTVLNLLSGQKPTKDELAAMFPDVKDMALEASINAGIPAIEALNSVWPAQNDGYLFSWPQDGDTKTINGVTYVLQNGRWHRVTPDASTMAPAKGADPDEVSAAGYTAALLAQKVPTKAQHQAWMQAIQDAADSGQDVAAIVKEHTNLVTAAIGQEKYIELIKALHQAVNQAQPRAQAAQADTSWHQKVHDHLDAILAKIAPTNTNYKTIKAKVDKYKKLLAEGKYAEILDANWGSNNYAKKIAQAHGIIKQHANAPSAAAKPTVVLTQPIAATPDESESWAFDTSMQMGSNHGGLYTDKNGQKWYVKIPKSEAHARNELLAAKLYEAAGVAVPNLKLVKSGGKVAIASQWQDGMSKVGSGIKTATGALEGFAVDAWLANYDSVGTGYDNLLKDANGNAVRIDVGGSLLFRAQGAPKTDFGDQVNELQTMLDPNKNSYSAAVFGGITDAQLKAGAAKVAAITPEQIKQLVQQYGPGTAAEKASLADRLIKRREDLLKKHPVAAAKPVAPKGKVGDLTNSKGSVLKWSVTKKDANGLPAEAKDAKGDTWYITAHADEQAAKKALLLDKFTEMMGATGTFSQIVHAGGVPMVAQASKGASSYPKPLTLRKVINGWWAGEPASSLGDVRDAVVALAKLNNSQINEMIAKVGTGDPDGDRDLADHLKQTRRDYLQHFNVADPWDVSAVDETKLQVDEGDLPKPWDFHNWKGQGQGLSSKTHVNAQNQKDDDALLAFAKQGNLTALKNYQYEAVDKDTGASLGLKPISEHPSTYIKEHWVSCVEVLTALAHPMQDSYSLPPFGTGTVEDVSEEVGYISPGENVDTVPAEKKLGYWMKLGHVGADMVADLMPKVATFIKGSEKPKAKSWYNKLNNLVSTWIDYVQGSGHHNHYWSAGEKKVNIGSQNVGLQKLTWDAYNAAVEKDEGTQIGRWMNMPHGMMRQLLQEGPGLVFQNTDSMCTSLFKNWKDHSHFGNGAFLNIRYAKGAKALDTYGSGSFNGGEIDHEGHVVHKGSGEMEITTLPGARFVVLGIKKGNASSKDGITLDLLMLPPHEGYLAEMDAMQKLGKAFLVFFRKTQQLLGGK